MDFFKSDIFKSDTFKLGVIFGGNIVLGAMFKKYNMNIEKQICCLSVQSLLSFSVNPTHIYHKIGLVTIAGISTGKLLYDEWRVYKDRQSNSRPLVDLSQTISYDLNSLLNPDLSNVKNKCSVFYKQIREHAVVPLCIIAIVGIAFVGYKNHVDQLNIKTMLYANMIDLNKTKQDIISMYKEHHEDIQKRFQAIMRVCYIDSGDIEKTVFSNIGFKYYEAIKYVSSNSLKQ
jgi:hypothetical protein